MTSAVALLIVSVLDSPVTLVNSPRKDNEFHIKLISLCLPSLELKDHASYKCNI